jgi:hypothetical protein
MTQSETDCCNTPAILELDAMATFSRRLTAAVLVLIAAAISASADEPDKESQPENKLIGSWRQVSAIYGGQRYTPPAGSTTVKHVTPSQFMWATYDAAGTVQRAAGGGYELKEDQYEETPEYGISDDFEIIRGKAQTFTWRVEDNKWYHNGKLSNGLTIEEVWERIDPE